MDNSYVGEGRKKTGSRRALLFPVIFSECRDASSVHFVTRKRSAPPVDHIFLAYAMILDLVGIVTMLVGVETVTGAGNIENCGTHVELIIVDKLANPCSAGFGIDLTIGFDGHDDIFFILVVVAPEFSNHPAGYIGAGEERTASIMFT
jgi:hypothetical protein